jgi:hypothetical protein
MMPDARITDVRFVLMVVCAFLMGVLGTVASGVLLHAH